MSDVAGWMKRYEGGEVGRADLFYFRREEGNQIEQCAMVNGVFATQTITDKRALEIASELLAMLAARK